MDSSFDLDIHNYTPNDLIKFFKLEKSYTLNDLVGKVADLTKEILSPNNTMLFLLLLLLLKKDSIFNDSYLYCV